MSEDLPAPIFPAGGSNNPVDPSPTPGVPSFVMTVGTDNQFEIIPQADLSTIITMGNTTTVDEVYFNGGIRYNTKTISDAGGPSYTLEKDDYFVVFTSNTYTTCVVPLASTRDGKTFIIARRYTGGSGLNIVTSGTDTFDGNTTIMTLPVSGIQTQIISDGVLTWNSM